MNMHFPQISFRLIMISFSAILISHYLVLSGTVLVCLPQERRSKNDISLCNARTGIVTRESQQNRLAEQTHAVAARRSRQPIPK